MELKDRIREAFRSTGLTQTAFAEKIGVSKGAVSLWLSGANQDLRAANAQAIQTVTGYSAAWLVSGRGAKMASPAAADRSPVPIPLENNPDYPAVRRVTFKLSAGASGFGVEYSDEEGPPIVFRRDWYERNGYRPEKLLAVRVCNGSMEPGLYDGDTVIVNTDAAEPADGVVFAVNYEGEMVVKRLVRDAGQWWLSSDNPDQRRYPRKVCDEHCILLGRIVHKQSERI